MKQHQKSLLAQIEQKRLTVEPSMSVVEENLNRKLSDMIEMKTALINEIREKEKVA